MWLQYSKYNVFHSLPKPMWLCFPLAQLLFLSKLKRSLTIKDWLAFGGPLIQTLPVPTEIHRTLLIFVWCNFSKNKFAQTLPCWSMTPFSNVIVDKNYSASKWCCFVSVKIRAFPQLEHSISNDSNIFTQSFEIVLQEVVQ